MRKSPEMPAEIQNMKSIAPTRRLTVNGPPRWAGAVLVILAVGDCWWHGFSYSLADAAMLLAGLALGVAVILGLTGGKYVEKREEHAVATQTLLAAAVTTNPTPQSLAPENASMVGPPTDLEKTLAEIAVLAWKIDKRAQKEASPPKPIIRNATRIIEMLGEHEVAMVSYEGRRIFDGSDVDVLETVEDVEEDQVVEQHEPEIQIRGKLVRKALLTVGKKKKPSPTTPASSMTPPATSQPTL